MTELEKLDYKIELVKINMSARKYIVPCIYILDAIYIQYREMLAELIHERNELVCINSILELCRTGK